MKIIIPTLRKEHNGIVLVDKLEEFLKPTLNENDEVKIIHDEKRTWEQVISDEVKIEDTMIMDDDIVIYDNDWRKKFEEYKSKYDVIGFKLLHPNGIIQHFGGFLRYDGVFYHPFNGCADYGLNYDMPCPYVTFSTIFIKKEVLEKIPIIADYMKTTGGSYLEDVDFCFRAREAGFKVGVIPVKFVHLESFTKKQDPKTSEKYKINLDIFTNKWQQKIMSGKI